MSGYDFMAEGIDVSRAMKRSEAKALGLRTYMPAKLCLHGHTAVRFVSNGGCSECLRAANRKYQEKHRDRLLPLKRQWAKDNPENNRAQSNEWQRDNREKASEIQRKARQKRISHYREQGRIHRAKRRAALLQRTPSWADLDLIAAIYRDCPQGMEVDHIVPLQGKNVSGLHVHNNLQYLTKPENSGKGAKWQ